MNKDLYNKVYTVPQNILNHISKYSGEEIIRNISSRKNLTYQNMKRLKNRMESGEKDKLGGDLFYNWIKHSLDSDRGGIELSKTTRQETGMENAHIRPHEKGDLRTMNRPSQSHSSAIDDLKIIENLQRINELISKI